MVVLLVVEVWLLLLVVVGVTEVDVVLLVDKLLDKRGGGRCG